MLTNLAPHARRGDLPARIETEIRAEKAAGSRDRKLYREILYTWVRHLPWFEGRTPAESVPLAALLAPELPATSRFRAAQATKDMPAGLDPTALLPAWLKEECPEAMVPPLRDALLRRAPLWLRVDPTRIAEIAEEFPRLGWPYRASTVLPAALRMEVEADITRSDAFTSGACEVQDLGSQLILESSPIAAGGHWLDACAGAGGKTLQLSALLGAGGKIDALDVRHAALNELIERARRARLDVSRRPTSAICVGSQRLQSYDGVLVDAPCSGTGTWRRSPHLKWCTSLAQVKTYADQQSKILAAQARFVKSGGLLIYSTCSLCRSENEAVIEDFLAKYPGYAVVQPRAGLGLEPGPLGSRILPQTNDTDGLFVAVLRAP